MPRTTTQAYKPILRLSTHKRKIKNLVANLPLICSKQTVFKKYSGYPGPLYKYYEGGYLPVYSGLYI